MSALLSRNGPLQRLRSLMTVVGVVLVVGGFYAVANADEETGELAADASQGSSAARLNPRAYVAIGAGVTRLEPESPTPLLEVADNQDAGFHIAVGYDFNRFLSAEAYFASLGSAGIDFVSSPVGEVDYQVYGISAIGYVFNSRSGFVGNGSTGNGLERREGLSLYGRLGIGGMSNSSDLDYRRDHTSHAAFGVGAEYGFSNGVALRAELSAYDTDANYLSVSLLKRFGNASQPQASRRARTVAAAPAPVAVNPVEPATAVAATTRMFRPIVPPYIYFDFDRHALSSESLAKLDGFITAIADTDFSVLVGGHTDWIASERYNTGLSQRRADAVHDYLVARGIAATRLSTEAYGETRPISTNNTVQGRAENRRVELHLR